MSLVSDAQPIRMSCADLAAAPVFPLPESFSVQNIRAGAEPTWLAVQLAAEKQLAITADWFWNDFGRDGSAHAERILFLHDANGKAVGTAAAWLDDETKRPELGRIHWVAIAPSHQGRGLAKPLVSATLQRLRELGHSSAYLKTDSSRPIAIRVYEAFGFHLDP